jgi:hypothetical protein
LFKIEPKKNGEMTFPLETKMRIQKSSCTLV